MPADDRLRLNDQQGVQNAGCKPIKARENEAIKIAKKNRFGAFLRSTLSWWRSATISASSVARDRKSPMTKHQVSLSKSPMKRSIARFGDLR
jgi:hypothetical protein